VRAAPFLVLIVLSFYSVPNKAPRSTKLNKAFLPGYWYGERYLPPRRSAVLPTSRKFLAAVLTECRLNLFLDTGLQGSGSAKVPLTLLRHSSLQMAGSRFAVLCLASCSQAKSLFGALVGLHLWHDRLPNGNFENQNSPLYRHHKFIERAKIQLIKLRRFSS